MSPHFIFPFAFLINKSFLSVTSVLSVWSPWHCTYILCVETKTTPKPFGEVWRLFLKPLQRKFWLYLRGILRCTLTGQLSKDDTAWQREMRRNNIWCAHWSVARHYAAHFFHCIQCLLLESDVYMILSYCLDKVSLVYACYLATLIYL